MTEDYKPTDNAIAERVNGIIKQEWLYRMKRPGRGGRKGFVGEDHRLLQQ